MNDRIAISLGSSMLACPTHAALLDTLHQADVRPVAVAGSSAGALAAGFYAAGLTGDRLKALALDPALRWSFIKRTCWIWHQFLYPWQRFPSLFDPSGAISFLESALGSLKIEDLEHPRLTIALTDLENNRSLLAQSGPLARVLVASSAVPFYLAPVPIAELGGTFQDGGLAHECPVDQWFEDDTVDTIIMHRIKTPTPPFSRFFPTNITDVLNAAYRLSIDQAADYRTQIATARGKRVITITTEQPTPSLLRTTGYEQYWQNGVDTGIRLLEILKAKQ